MACSACGMGSILAVDQQLKADASKQQRNGSTKYAGPAYAQLTPEQVRAQCSSSSGSRAKKSENTSSSSDSVASSSTFGSKLKSIFSKT